jgi:hypothetical protein
MFDSDFMEIIGKGNREEAIRKLKLFAANYVGAINAPGVSGNPSVYLPSDPRVFMDKLVGVTKKFKDIDGVNSFMTEATKALGSQEGIWHVLRNVESPQLSVAYLLLGERLRLRRPKTCGFQPPKRSLTY